MALSTQSHSRDRLPRDVRTPGPLHTDAVVGLILSIEERALGQASAIVVAPPSQPGGGAGKQGKKGKTGKGKGKFSDAVLEVLLCGGKNPGDVILFQAWEADTRGRLRASGSVGDVVRIKQCLIVAHSDKTRWFTTSRSPMFLKAQAGTTMERIDPNVAFSSHHPVTPISSLPLLPARSLVCLAGRVVEAGEVAHVETPDGDTDVPVAHLVIRVSGDVVRINFWRETAALISDLKNGDFTFLWAVAKQYPKAGENNKSHVELRATARTKVMSCPEPLKSDLANTLTDLSGARVWSSRVSKERKDYVAAPGTWMSLSVLDAFCASKQIRDLDRVFEVPSVFLEFGSQLTYSGCNICSKAWRDESNRPCQCGEAKRVHLWRAKLGLRDATGHIQAVCFRAIESVVKVYEDASGDSGKAPEHFSTDEMAQLLAIHVSAVPFTARITVAADGYKESMEATVQLLAPTFSITGVKHPLKPVVQMGQAAGACPPFRLRETAYAEGVGMTEAHGNAFESFRAFVTFVDDAAALSDDGRVSREVRCACDTAEEGTAKYSIQVEADDSKAKALADVAKGASAHILLAWTSTDTLGMIAMMPVPSDSCDSFCKFFSAEVRMCQDAAAASPSNSATVNDTPLRILTAAEQANVTSPPMWKARKTLPTQ